MTRAQKLEEAIIDFLQNTNSQTLLALYALVDVCSACNRDLAREGRCSACNDERRPVHQNFLDDE